MSKKKYTPKVYSPAEEKLNARSHAFGIVMGFVSLVFMLIKANDSGKINHIVAALVFGISIILLYIASTIYHSTKEESKRHRMKVFDHSAIYILIAGSYTPYALIILEGSTGRALLIANWSMAAIGITLKIFFTGRFNAVSTAMYIFMGWSIAFVSTDLLSRISAEGFSYLLAGGISYTVGAFIYSIKKIPYNHGIFHVFVLLGSFLHIISVYFYIL